MPDYEDWGDTKSVLIYIDPGDGTGPNRLRTKNGLLQVQNGEPAPTTVRVGTTPVSTLTHVTNWTNLGALYEQLLFFGFNDTGNDINLVVETSQDGVHADAAQRAVTVPNGGGQASIEVLGSIALYYRLSAYTNNPFPTAALGWGITGVPRVGM